MWAGHQGRTVGRWAALGLLGGVLALLGACSSGGTPPAADSTTSAGRPVAAAAAPGSGPPARTRIQYGMVSRNVHNWPIFVAEQQGFFEHEGLEVETTQTGASVRAVQFVASGSLDVVSASADAVILGHDRGAPVVIVGGVNRAVYSLVAQPHIRAYSALRGATLGVSALKGGETTHLRKLLQARGLQESDYHLVVGGGTAERYIAFRSGAFDAAMLPSPEDVQLRQDGYPILGSSKEVLPHFPFLTMAARQDWAAANADTLVRWLRAVGRAIDWIYDPSNREGALRGLTEGIGATREAAEQTYEGWIVQDHILYPRGAIDLASIQAMLELMLEQGDLSAPLPPPERFVDLRYQEAALRAP
ncbi:MAG TPA: ABC transporter substrate-binding protein [Chloroflexota bacterium]|jgi:NitT/TauT family transport system substrate-binding protein|nr:ABC transporter substrate-binding protein [Chloroflexota bacterium]